MENLLSDPSTIGLILIILGAVGLAGGVVQSSRLSLTLQTVKGRIALLFSVFVIIGLAILIIDLRSWWGVE